MAFDTHRFNPIFLLHILLSSKCDILNLKGFIGIIAPTRRSKISPRTDTVADLYFFSAKETKFAYSLKISRTFFSSFTSL